MARIGIVTGMIAEAQALGRWVDHADVSVAVSGARPAQAEAEARRLVSEGAQVLVSWGLAGGLADDLASGTLIEPGAVLLPDGARVEVATGGRTDMAILGVEEVISDPARKAELRSRTGAIAIDMESHRLAQVAAETGVAFRIVRAISDPWDRALPALAATALGADGRPRIARVMAGLARRPWELPRLLAAKADSDQALATLRGAADRVFSELTPGPAAAP